MFKHLTFIARSIPICLVSCIFTYNTTAYGQSVSAISEQTAPEELVNIDVKPLFSDSLSSSFLIWIKNEVRAHKHSYHSEQVYIIEGKGILTLGGEAFEIQTGDLIYIPKNTIHSVQVTSKNPMKAISIQAPFFEGKDRVFVD